jgi:hypothetical protein
MRATRSGCREVRTRDTSPCSCRWGRLRRTPALERKLRRRRPALLPSVRQAPPRRAIDPEWPRGGSIASHANPVVRGRKRTSRAPAAPGSKSPHACQAAPTRRTVPAANAARTGTPASATTNLRPRPWRGIPKKSAPCAALSGSRGGHRRSRLWGPRSVTLKNQRAVRKGASVEGFESSLDEPP